MPRVIEMHTPIAFEPLLGRARYKGAYGGRGGAKSHFFGDYAVDRALDRGFRLICVREYQTSLRDSVKRLIEDKLEQHGLGPADGFRVLQSHIETPGDGVILFQGMQAHNSDTIKSFEGFDAAWIEEAQSLSQRSLRLLDPTLRKPGAELWFSWNPRYAADPVDDFFRGNDSKSRGLPWTPPPSSALVNVNYYDNPYFPDVLRQKMEWDKSRDPEMYAHVWMGDYERRAESRVFKNYKVEAFDEPAEGTRFYFGADWGFSQDPSTMVRMWISGNNLMLSHEAYAVGVEIDDLPALFDTVPDSRRFPVVADSARPETISYMRRHGYPLMRPAIKGRHSVIEGVHFLQSYDIVIHPRCEHAISEFARYRYKVDKQTEKVTYPLELEDAENHIIDPCRYGVEDLRRGDDWLVA